MGPLRQCWRAVFNLLPLRGRKRRLAKLLVVLLLSAAISLLVLNGACVPGTGRCGEEGLQRVREEFEIPRDYVSFHIKAHLYIVWYEYEPLVYMVRCRVCIITYVLIKKRSTKKSFTECLFFTV